MSDMQSVSRRLESWLVRAGRVAVAVSGGVDSMTLSAFAQRTLGTKARMCHAISPAVPPEATARVRAYAEREGWQLETFNAGEFDDARYMSNPSNRCYFCKTNLYAHLAGRAEGVLVSGTNTDDLGDYRPGLRAAEEHGVRHPYVEVGIDKARVRALAQALGLDDIAELPAAPCLSSRVETGIAIDPKVLVAINTIEKHLRAELSPRTARCRLRERVIAIELDEQTHARLDGATKQALTDYVSSLFEAMGIARPIDFDPYRMGSAFLRPRVDSGK